MKRYITSALWMLGVVLTQVSCLDLDPQDQLSDAQAWNKADNFKLFTNQFYGWTRDFQGSTSVTYMNGTSDGVHSDLRSDLLCASSVNVYSAGKNTIPSSDANYNELYKRIYYTNLLLDRASGFANQDAIKEARGEAYFFRAYLHFELVQIFGNCILLQKPLDLDSGELYGPRDDRSVVVDAIIGDLKTAAGLLPETPSASGRVCSYAAWAMISRVALYEGTWQKFHNNNLVKAKELLRTAADAAHTVMESRQYELFYSSILGTDSYRYMFLLEDVACNPSGATKSANKEYIFARRHDEVLKPINTNITHTASNNAWYVTRKMANMYLCQNGLPIELSNQFEGYATATSEFTNRDNRMNGTLMKHGQAYWNNDGKWRTAWNDTDLANSMTAGCNVNSGYANYKWATERHVEDNYEGYDWPIIRYAEVLLNYAEAKFEIEESILDDDLDISLNLVRRRINPGMPRLSEDLIAANPGMSMREEIRRERTVELFLEGFRIDDLKRWKAAETEMPMNLLGVKYSGTQFETIWTSQSRPLNSDGCIIMESNRVWQTKHYLYPLPADQMQLNPALGQNKDWN